MNGSASLKEDHMTPLHLCPIELRKLAAVCGVRDSSEGGSDAEVGAWLRERYSRLLSYVRTRWPHLSCFIFVFLVWRGIVATEPPVCIVRWQVVQRAWYCPCDRVASHTHGKFGVGLAACSCHSGRCC